MPPGEALMSGRSFGQRIACGDRHFKFGRLYGPAQPFELPDAGNRVVADDFEALAWPWLGLDTIGVGDAPAAADRA
jgi:hypothetical protein